MDWINIPRTVVFILLHDIFKIKAHFLAQISASRAESLWWHHEPQTLSANNRRETSALPVKVSRSVKQEVLEVFPEVKDAFRFFSSPSDAASLLFLFPHTQTLVLQLVPETDLSSLISVASRLLFARRRP